MWDKGAQDGGGEEQQGPDVDANGDLDGQVQPRGHACWHPHRGFISDTQNFSLTKFTTRITNLLHELLFTSRITITDTIVLRSKFG